MILEGGSTVDKGLGGRGFVTELFSVSLTSVGSFSSLVISGFLVTVSSTFVSEPDSISAEFCFSVRIL